MKNELFEKELSNYELHLKREQELRDNPLSLYKIKDDFLKYLDIDPKLYYIKNFGKFHIDIESKKNDSLSITFGFHDECDENIGYTMVLIRNKKEFNDKTQRHLIEHQNKIFNFYIKESFTIFDNLEVKCEDVEITESVKDGVYYSWTTNMFYIKTLNFFKKNLTQFYLEKYFSITPDEELLNLIISKDIFTPKDGILTMSDEVIEDLLMSFKNNMNLSDLKEFFTLNYKV